MANRRQQSNRTRARSVKNRRRPGLLSILLFWPFHLFFHLIRGSRGLKKTVMLTIGIPMLSGLIGIGILSLIYGYRAMDYDLSRLNKMPERTIIYDRNQIEIGRIHGVKRSIVPLGDVSDNFLKAIIAREDERFYSHYAIDLIGIGRAVIKNFEGKREGASTITQQLASDIFQLKRGEKKGDLPRQIDRKFLEIAIAFRIESKLSKDRILEAYINHINWGRQIKGVGEASRIYFEKHPSQLTLSESALLAGIVRGPDAYNPFRSIEASRRERNTTLERMVAAKAITRKQADDAEKEPITVRPAWRREHNESYAMDAIRRDLELILEKENIELGGLIITTTIDQRLQKVAEEAVEKKLSQVERMYGYRHQTRAKWLGIPEDQRKLPEYIQSSAVLIENRTGAVIALVGGRDADESPFNRALQARRQIGSVFKPFVYLAAFDKGLRPSTLISDGPIQSGEIKGDPGWKPSNADGKFGGMNPASYGLIRSRNTMSVRIGNYAGLAKVKEVSRTAGFGLAMPEKPSSFLGSWEATPYEVATAYTIFPNDGVRYRPFIISEIRDKKNNVLYATHKIDYQAANPGSAWSVSNILQEVASSGTAASMKSLGFTQPAAGKTGTTNDFKDAWFAGYTSSLTCAVWTGFDQPKKTFHGGFGSALSLPIWVDIMKTADRLGYKAGPLHSKMNMMDIHVCRLSGKNATSGCVAAGTAYHEKVPADSSLTNTEFCPIHPPKALSIDPIALPPVTHPDHPQRAIPVGEPLRSQDADQDPPRAQPVEVVPETPRAEPVPPRAEPLE
jgi:penicillin-binding protein 1A